MALCVGCERRRVRDQVVVLDLTEVLLEAAIAELVLRKARGGTAAAETFTAASLGLDFAADGACEGRRRGNIIAEKYVLSWRATQHGALHAEGNVARNAREAELIGVDGTVTETGARN